MVLRIGQLGAEVERVSSMATCCVLLVRKDGVIWQTN